MDVVQKSDVFTFGCKQFYVIKKKAFNFFVLTVI